MTTFAEACEPLIKWVAENCNPHQQVLVDSTTAELLTGVKTHVNKTFVKD